MQKSTARFLLLGSLEANVGDVGDRSSHSAGGSRHLQDSAWEAARSPGLPRGWEGIMEEVRRQGVQDVYKGALCCLPDVQETHASKDF